MTKIYRNFWPNFRAKNLLRSPLRILPGLLVFKLRRFGDLFCSGFLRRWPSLHLVFSTLLQRYSTAAAAKPLNRLSNGLDDHKKGIEAESGKFHKPEVNARIPVVDRRSPTFSKIENFWKFVKMMSKLF